MKQKFGYFAKYAHIITSGIKDRNKLSEFRAAIKKNIFK